MTIFLQYFAKSLSSRHFFIAISKRNMFQMLSVVLFFLFGKSIGATNYSFYETPINNGTGRDNLAQSNGKKC